MRVRRVAFRKALVVSRKTLVLFRKALDLFRKAVGSVPGKPLVLFPESRWFCSEKHCREEKKSLVFPECIKNKLFQLFSQLGVVFNGQLGGIAPLTQPGVVVAVP